MTDSGHDENNAVDEERRDAGSADGGKAEKRSAHTIRFLDPEWESIEAYAETRGLTDRRRQALGDVEMTRDGIVRVRPNVGLILERGDSSIDASTLASLAGEVVLNERALTSGTVVAGHRPAAALLVENLGPYLDVQVSEDWMIIHVPGWNTATVKHVLDQLGSVPLVHFGDLDPEGVEIVTHLRRSYPRLRWAVPTFWKEYVPERARRKRWPEDIALDGAPALVHELKQSSLWLEQETIVLDHGQCDLGSDVSAIIGTRRALDARWGQ